MRVPKGSGHNSAKLAEKLLNNMSKHDKMIKTKEKLR